MTLPSMLIVWICSYCDWNRHPDPELLVHTLSHRSFHTCFNRHAVFSGDVMLLTDKPCCGVIVIFVELSNYPFCDIDRTACVFSTIHSSLEQPNKTPDMLHTPPLPTPPPRWSHLFNYLTVISMDFSLHFEGQSHWFYSEQLTCWSP